MSRVRRANVAVGCVCVGVAALVVFWPAERPVPSETSDYPSLPAIDQYPLFAKGEVVHELIGASVTLADAVARCQELNRQYSETTRISQYIIDKYYPGHSPEERLAHNLMELCHKTLEDDTD